MTTKVELRSSSFDELIAAKKKQLDEDYGKKICEALGYKEIEKITEVTASQLSLNAPSKYHECQAIPGKMGSHNIVRGIDGSKRPFIAMKCDLLDGNKKKITEVVELFFLRLPYTNGGYRQDQVVTSLFTKGADNVKYASGFNHPDWGECNADRLKKVIGGETVEYMVSYNFPFSLKPQYIRMSLIQKTYSLDELIAAKKKQLDEDYGKKICEALGYEEIEKITEVTASQLSLNTPSKYHECQATPEKMGSHNIVRVKDNWDRWIIAIKCDLLDAQNKEITKVVELIFQRFPTGKGGYREGEVTCSLQTKGINEETYSSGFGLVGGGVNLAKVKKVFNDETVKTTPTGHLVNSEAKYIRMSKE